LLWSTDFLHGINPAVVGIGVGLMAFIPGLGILDEKDFKAANFSLIIFISAALSMGNILVDTQVLSTLANTVFRWLEPLIAQDQLHDHLLAAGLYGAANVFHLLLGNEPALLSASLPLVLQFAKDQNLNPEAIGMIWVFAAGGKLFVYQSGVLAVGYSFGVFTSWDLLKLGAAIIVMEGINIALITPLYWNLMGLTMH
jgi:di/tricarboxylate transporter